MKIHLNEKERQCCPCCSYWAKQLTAANAVVDDIERLCRKIGIANRLPKIADIVSGYRKLQGGDGDG